MASTVPTHGKRLAMQDKQQPCKPVVHAGNPGVHAGMLGVLALAQLPRGAGRLQPPCRRGRSGWRGRHQAAAAFLQVLGPLQRKWRCLLVWRRLVEHTTRAFATHLPSSMQLAVSACTRLSLSVNGLLCIAGCGWVTAPCSIAPMFSMLLFNASDLATARMYEIGVGYYGSGEPSF